MAQPSSVGIFYACVAKRGDVQVECGEKAMLRNSLKAFIDGTIAGPAAQKEKGSFNHGPFSYNFLKDGGNTFVAIASKDVETRIVFNFLGDMRKAFEAGSDKGTYTRNLNKLLVQYKNPADMDRIKRIAAELEDVKGVMRDNLDKMVKRGEQLETLDQATVQLEQDASAFKTNAIKVRKVVWWRRIRLWIIVGAVLVVIVFIVIVIVCGGFTFKDCKGK